MQRHELRIDAPWRQCARIYEDRESALLRQAAATSGGPLCLQLHRLREKSLSMLRANPLYCDWIRKVGRSLTRHGVGNAVLARRAFHRLNRQLIPVLRIPPPFQKRLKKRPSEVIERSQLLSPVADSVKEILDTSLWKRDFRKFRTINSGTRRIIYGNNNKTFESLSGLAHEVGHCLLENGYLPRLPRSAVWSETVAHLCEHEIVIEYLEEEGVDDAVRRNWMEYQTSVDRLNWAFFAFELANVITPEITAETQFSPNALIFRESLFTMPGYQVIYALASQKRNEVLLSGKSLKQHLAKWK